MPQTLNSSLYHLDTIFHTTIPSSSMTLNYVPLLHWISLALAFNLNLKLHISSLLKLLLLYQYLTLYKGLIHPWMRYSSYVWWLSESYLNRVELKVFRLISSSPLTIFSLFLNAGIMYLLLSFIAIFMLTALLIFLTACLPFCGLTAQDFLPLTHILSSCPMQESTSTFNHSLLSLVNSGTPCLPLYFQLSLTWLYLSGRFQDNCPWLLANSILSGD